MISKKWQLYTNQPISFIIPRAISSLTKKTYLLWWPPSFWQADGYLQCCSFLLWSVPRKEGEQVGSLVAQMAKHLAAVQETRVQSLCWEDPLEKEMATHSSTLAWKIAWTEEPGRLHSPWGRKESDTTEQLHFHLESRDWQNVQVRVLDYWKWKC